VSEPEESRVFVPPDLLAGVWADDVDVFADVDHATVDFIRSDPRSRAEGILVARVAASRWCILKLKRDLEGFD